MDMIQIKVGDQVNVEVHDGEEATLTPIRSRPTAADVSSVIADVMNDYAQTLSRLA